MSEPGFPEFKSGVKRTIQERVHLREDVAPISLQLEDYGTENEELESLREQLEDNVNNVDLENGDLEALKKNGFKTSGFGSYLISPIGGGVWHSDRYFNCTAVVAIGREASTGQEISFLSHQDPRYFVDGGTFKTEMFSRELSDSLKELRARSQSDTVEVLLLGGNYSVTATEVEGDYQHRHYKQSIEKLRKIVQDSLGFDPKVLTGPNNNVGSETVVIVETQKRKVWVERTKQSPEFDQPYMANALDEVERKWAKTEK
ncbi:hypothetical protein EPO05_01915 [Patescibacteria group bacterium]|nr:MAG: hypothetical protein EPO05_01915 [Patescibacteria group bacterium]